MPGQQRSPAPDFNQRIIDEFRACGGTVAGMFSATPLILITTEGRHSHRPRTNPVTYLRDGGRYLIFGSNLGRPAHPGWYHNLLASPQATMEFGTGDGHVRTLSPGQRSCTAPSATGSTSVSRPPAPPSWTTRNGRPAPSPWSRFTPWTCHRTASGAD